MAGDLTDDTTVVDVVQAAFDDTDLAAVAAAVRAGRADDRLGRYHQMWQEWANRWRPPAGTGDRLRPYLFNNWSGHDSGGLATAWMDLVGQPAGAAVLRQQLVRHLLFCDGVALPDPFVRVTGSSGRPRIAGMFADLPAVRSWAAAAIESLHTYRELVSERVIVVVPAQASQPRLAQAATSAVAGDPLMPDHFPAPPAGWWGLTQAQVAAVDLLTQIATAGGALDPYLPTAGHLAVFRRILTSADSLVGEQVGRASTHPLSALLPSVLTCQLPDPGDVTVADIVAIRRDGHFGAWREAVAEGVRRFRATVGDNLDQWPDAGQGLRRSIAEQVRAEADRQKAAIGWSRHPAVDVSIDLVLVAGSAAAAFTAPPVAAALGSLGAAKLLTTVVRRWRFGRGAFGRHMAVFSRSP